jgi:CRISPR-associated protein Cas2
VLLVAYDISNNKLRTKFSKFLSKFGYRLQYSIFEIKNSKRILSVVEAEIKSSFEKRFAQTDSVIIFSLSKQCKVTKYGYVRNDDEDLLVL